MDENSTQVIGDAEMKEVDTGEAARNKAGEEHEPEESVKGGIAKVKKEAGEAAEEDEDELAI